MWVVGQVESGATSLVIGGVWGWGFGLGDFEKFGESGGGVETGGRVRRETWWG